MQADALAAILQRRVLRAAAAASPGNLLEGGLSGSRPSPPISTSPKGLQMLGHTEDTCSGGAHCQTRAVSDAEPFPAPALESWGSGNFQAHVVYLGLMKTFILTGLDAWSPPQLRPQLLHLTIPMEKSAVCDLKEGTPQNLLAPRPWTSRLQNCEKYISAVCQPPSVCYWL